jgi:hypothetical protein
MNPNSNNQIQSNSNNFFGIKVSRPGFNVNNATDSQLIYKSNYSTETFYNNGIPQILIGLLPDGTYGLVISKVGIDVNTLFT